MSEGDGDGGLWIRSDCSEGDDVDENSESDAEGEVDVGDDDDGDGLGNGDGVGVGRTGVGKTGDWLVYPMFWADDASGVVS